MNESEKLTALKNVYVDVILNTAKEAAARIMVAEKKAIRFQRELSTAKDEGLRILLGLKGMLDSKVREADLASLNQQRKIEELEAQLGEAEDIVRDLRVELQEVQDELEKLTRKKVHNLEANIATPEDITQENRLSKFNLTPNGAYPGNECDSTNDFRMDYNHVCNPDFATIAIRSKEPEKYTNGCTQRICEFEKDSLDVKVHLSREAENIKNGIFIRGDEETENIFGEEEDSNMLKVIKEEDSSDFEEPITKSSCRKRNGQARNNKRKAPSDPDLYCCELLSVDNNNQSGNGSSKIVEKDVQNGPVFSSAQNVPLATENDMAFIKACSSLKTTNNNKAVLDKSDLTSQESLSLENLEVQTGKRYAEAVKESFVHSDMKDSDFDDEIPSPPPSTRFLRYTFQRKRKKDSLSSPDGNSSFDDGTLEGKMGKKDNSPVASEKSSLTMDMDASDSRRLAQVVCQLIPLSDKKR